MADEPWKTGITDQDKKSPSDSGELTVGKIPFLASIVQHSDDDKRISY